MKKSKQNGRGKASTVVKDEQKEVQSPKLICSVCRFEGKDSDAMLCCQVCKNYAHQACYNSEYIPGRQPFKCDLCKQKKLKKKNCTICVQYYDKQMLKSCRVSNSDNVLPIHVQCALMSSQIQIQSYSKLQISRKDQRQHPGRKEDCCGTVYPGPIAHCVVCSAKWHFRCKIVELASVEDNYMITRWLDKCQRYQFLLNYIVAKKKTHIKSFVDMPKPHKQNQLVVCNKHSQQYPWCYCDNWQISNKPQNPDYQCDQCDRFVHQPCSGLPPKYQKGFTCRGCSQNDIFKKQLKLHQLIMEIVKVQKVSRFDDSIIRLLNAFPFKYSSIIQRKINQNIKQIQLYFSRRQIQKMLEINNYMENEKAVKKLIQMLLYLIHGQKWKEFDTPQLAVSSIQQSTIIKKLKLPKQVTEKLNEILRSKQKQKKKSKEYQAFKQALVKFISQWKVQNNTENNNSKYHDKYLKLAASIKQLQTKFLLILQQSQKQQDKKIILDKFSEIMGNQVYGVLLGKQCSIQLIAIILRKLSKFKYFKRQNTEISESQYYKLIGEKGISLDNFNNKQKVIWNNFMSMLKNQVSGLPIVYNAVRKQKLFKNYQNSIKQNSNDAKSLRNAQRQAILNQVCTINSDSSLNFSIGISANTIKFQVMQQRLLKKKFLKICSEQDTKLTQIKIKGWSKIQDFYRRRKNILSNEQKKCFQSYIGKIQYLQAIFRKGQALQHYSMEASMNENNLNNTNSNQNQQLNSVYLKLFHILDHWDQRIVSIQFLINQFYNKIVRKQIKYNNKQIQERLKIFYKHIILKIQYSVLDGQKISTQLLRKLCKILTYFEIQGQFGRFVDLLQSVRKWCNIFSNPNGYTHSNLSPNTNEQIPSNISTFLQKSQKVTNMIKTLDSKILSGMEIESINVYSQINKLCLFRQWCKLSQKISLLTKNKATINAIQTLKGLLEKSSYPQNSLSKKVVQLDIQGKNINLEVSKFLQKPKLPQYFKFNQQLKFISTKMSLEQGQSIKQLLQKSNLDVYVQTQQLQNQIRQFESLPNQVQLATYSERKNLNQLNLLRKKYIDSCFKVNKLQQYQKFLRRIYVLKCINFQPPITRQQYYEYLLIGGVAALQLQNKTTGLSKAYQIIEKAQNQLSNSSYKKRNYNNLLPWSQQKYKQIKQDLKYDPTETSKLQKARLANNKVRDQYCHLRTKKVEIQKFKQIQLDLSTSIFNNRDILSQIAHLKSQIDNYVRKVEEVLPYSQSHITHSPLINENIFKVQRRIYDAYNSLRIRHPSLQKFCHDYQYYYKSQAIRTELTIQNYRSYCDACSRMSELACRIPDILHTRTSQFIKMHKNIMEAQQYHMHLFQLLITQGLELRRMETSPKDKVFSMVIQVYQKVRQVMSVNPAEISDSEEGIKDQQDQQIMSESGEMEDEDDQNQEDDSDDIDEEVSDDFDDDASGSSEFDQDEDEDEGGNGNGNKEIVLDSD